ncbi:MAG: hypothetical protein ACOYIK_08130, partial [Coriobacteriales bacterium]
EVIGEKERLNVSFLNPDNGEKRLFESMGFEVWSADHFCVRIYDEECEGACDMKVWELRKVDADYYLNVNE